MKNPAARTQMVGESLDPNMSQNRGQMMLNNPQNPQQKGHMMMTGSRPMTGPQQQPRKMQQNQQMFPADQMGGTGRFSRAPMPNHGRMAGVVHHPPSQMNQLDFDQTSGLIGMPNNGPFQDHGQSGGIMRPHQGGAGSMNMGAQFRNDGGPGAVGDQLQDLMNPVGQGFPTSSHMQPPQHNNRRRMQPMSSDGMIMGPMQGGMPGMQQGQKISINPIGGLQNTVNQIPDVGNFNAGGNTNNTGGRSTDISPYNGPRSITNQTNLSPGGAMLNPLVNADKRPGVPDENTPSAKIRKRGVSTDSKDETQKKGLKLGI